MTPLIRAVGNVRATVVKLLLATEGVNRRHREFDGQNPITRCK
jgi:hypothetical protein